MGTLVSLDKFLAFNTLCQEVVRMFPTLWSLRDTSTEEPRLSSHFKSPGILRLFLALKGP